MTSDAGTPPNDRPTLISSGLVVHLQVPELVLQDDRHLLRILRAQPRRDHDAGMIGAERDVEMVLAGQAVGGGVLTARTTTWRIAVSVHSS